MKRYGRAAGAAILGGICGILLGTPRAACGDDSLVLRVEDDIVAVAGEDDQDAAEDDESGVEGTPVSLFVQPPIQPAAPEVTEFGLATPASAASLSDTVFGSDLDRRSMLSETRRSTPAGTGSELVFGSEGRFRVTTDGGNLLGKSMFAPSVKTQQRTPVITDPRVRGARAGRLLASGSYWMPARQDLDTLMSKIDSRIISNVIVVKGPYSVRYGPGTNFIDFKIMETPRYDCCPQWEGMTSFEYKTNGEQLYGRDMVWGGGENYGYRVGYGHRTGNDYRDGSGFRLPSSYNSRDFDVALGYDFSDTSSIEFNYLRLDQTGVEFPGLVFDINALVTDGFEILYRWEDQQYFDLLTVEGWYNRTRFHGDTSRPGKTRQIPTVNFNHNLVGAPGVVPSMPGEFLITNVDGMSAGYRAAMTWGQPGFNQVTVGTDMIRNGTQLNDIVPAHTDPPPLPFLPPVAIPTLNFPIPRARSMDIGLFLDHQRPVSDNLTINAGARVDMIATDAEDTAPDYGGLFGFPPMFVPKSLSAEKQAGLNQHFTPWAVFMTADYQVDSCWTLTAGAGFAMRPPDLTELYADGPFIGTLQPGQTFIEGDPELDPERHHQIDVGARADYGSFRLNAAGFFAYINDYIVYDVFADPAVPGDDLMGVAIGNTDRATLTGFELYAEQDLRDWVSAFAVASYVVGRDHDRDEETRVGNIERGGPGGGRSSVMGVPEENLPGIPPLEARLGLRFKDPYCDLWGWEIEARVVDNQDRVAATLLERPTPGFTVWNLRGYYRPYEKLTLVGGVENFTDNRYREHLDYRPGLGVFRPGINFYSAAELRY